MELRLIDLNLVGLAERCQRPLSIIPQRVCSVGVADRHGNVLDFDQLRYLCENIIPVLWRVLRVELVVHAQYLKHNRFSSISVSYELAEACSRLIQGALPSLKWMNFFIFRLYILAIEILSVIFCDKMRVAGEGEPFLADHYYIYA